MNEIIEILSLQGCDMRGALRRFLDDEKFYLRCLDDFFRQDGFGQIAAAVAVRDYRAAFEAAHDQKGVSASLGLTPFYRACCAVVEDLRGAERELFAPDTGNSGTQADSAAEPFVPDLERLKRDMGLLKKEKEMLEEIVMKSAR